MARAEAPRQEQCDPRLPVPKQRQGVRRVGLGGCADPFKESRRHVERSFIFDFTGSLLLHTGFLSLQRAGHAGA